MGAKRLKLNNWWWTKQQQWCRDALSLSSYPIKYNSALPFSIRKSSIYILFCWMHPQNFPCKSTWPISKRIIFSPLLLSGVESGKKERKASKVHAALLLVRHSCRLKCNYNPLFGRIKESDPAATCARRLFISILTLSYISVWYNSVENSCYYHFLIKCPAAWPRPFITVGDLSYYINISVFRIP